MSAHFSEPQEVHHIGTKTGEPLGVVKVYPGLCCAIRKDGEKRKFVGGGDPDDNIYSSAVAWLTGRDD